MHRHHGPPRRPRAEAAVIDGGIAPWILGADPLATERLWDVMYRACVHGRKGLEMMAISALDCALWDLKGRHFGVPVHVLLGGPTRCGPGASPRCSRSPRWRARTTCSSSRTATPCRSTRTSVSPSRRRWSRCWSTC
ncbi:MAG: hypothetical protein GEV11_20920 [Streptosporangiales bacterium]|nr:hypothetical protein [Streptosporangiales bacterium]